MKRDNNINKPLYTQKSNSRSGLGSIGFGSIAVSIALVLSSSGNDVENIEKSSVVASVPPQQSKINSLAAASSSPTESDDIFKEYSSLSGWKVDPEVSNILNKSISTGDTTALLKSIPKLSKEKQLLILDGMNEFGMKKIFIENFYLFDKLSRKNLNSFIFQETAVVPLHFGDIITAMQSSKIYDNDEIMLLFDKMGYSKLIYSFIGKLTSNPYEYLQKKFGTPEEHELGIYFSEYNQYLTPIQLSDLREKLEINHIAIIDLNSLEEERRLILVNESIQNKEYSTLSLIIKPEDPIDKGALLAKMLSEQDYLGILENSEFFSLYQYQKAEYTDMALTLNTKKVTHWFRVFDLVNKGIIPDQFLLRILQGYIASGLELNHIIQSEKLLNLYGKENMITYLFKQNQLSSIVDHIGILKPTKKQAIQLCSLLVVDKSPYIRNHFGLVLEYMNSI